VEGVYYQHSGKYSAGGLLTGTLIGLIVACVTAWLYAYLILYIPIAGYISFLFTAAFGGIVGFAMAKLLKGRQVRNTPVAVLATLVVTTAAFYFHWAVWVNAALRRADIESSLDIALVPSFLFAMINEINATGAWTIRSWTPSGTALWVIWTLEAAIVYVLAVAVAVGEMNSDPYCENCHAWCPKTEAVLNVAAAPDQEEFKRRVEARDVRYLEQLGAMAQGAMAWEQIDLHTCPKCNSTNTLSVQHVTVKMEKNEAKQETSESVAKLVLGISEADAIRRLGEKFKAAAVASAAAAGSTAG